MTSVRAFAQRRHAERPPRRSSLLDLAGLAGFFARGPAPRATDYQRAFLDGVVAPTARALAAEIERDLRWRGAWRQPDLDEIWP